MDTAIFKLTQVKILRVTTLFFFISNQPSDGKLLSNFQGSTLFH